MYAVFAVYSSTFPPFLPPPPFHWYSPFPKPDLFCLPGLSFCRRKRKNNKMTFLLLWDKGSYIGSFLVIFPCIYVL
jgi:hypothetical protein